MSGERVFRYQKIEGGEGRYILGRFDTVLHIKCPLDDTSIIQTQEQDRADFCPNCGTRYYSLDPKDMREIAKERLNQIPEELKSISERQQKLIAIILAARERKI